MRHIWFACAALTGCVEPAITLDLETPTVVDFDMSCLQAVDVMGFSQAMLDEAPPDIGVHAHLRGEQPNCVDVSNVTSFADLLDKLRGRVDVPIPAEGLAAIEIRGRASTCEAEPYGQSLVYGGGMYLPGASFVSVPIAANITCKAATRQTVQPIDMLSLIADPSHACTLLADGANTDVTYPAVIRPSNMSWRHHGPTDVLFESGGNFQPLGTDGTATFASYTAVAPSACIAVARASEKFQGGTCVNAAAPKLCATSAIELPVITADKTAAVTDPALVNMFGNPVAGFAWVKSGSTKAPLANATVTVDDPAIATVRYLDIANGVLANESTARATGASGIFFVYTNGVTGITVTAAGHTPQHVVIGPSGSIQATTLVVLE